MPSIKKVMEVQMVNYRKMADKQRIQVLIGLGWSYQQIQRETGIEVATEFIY